MIRNGRPDAPSAAPLFAVAMLRIALELNKDPQLDLEATAARVATRMRLDVQAFRRHLEVNHGLLRTTAQAALTVQPARAPARSRRTQRG